MATITKTISEVLTNNIYIGNKQPKAIYKGTTEIKKVYKGSTVIYEKGNIVYTLIGENSSCNGGAEVITFTVTSYKGTNSRVEISKSNVSILSGQGASVQDVRQGTNNIYLIDIKVPSNSTYDTDFIYKIRITQPNSGQTMDLTGTSYKLIPYITLTKVGFRFSGAFPAQIWETGVSTVVFGNQGEHFQDFWGTDSTSSAGYVVTGNWLQTKLSAVSSTSTPSESTGTVYWNNSTANSKSSWFASGQSWPSPKVKNGDVFSASFNFGGTWSGTTTYQGYTWNFHAKDLTSGKTYIESVTSSKQWQVGVQPSYIGIQTKFQNIKTSTSISLIIDFNWSWDSYWNNNT